MRFRVIGADRATGDEVEIIVDAQDEVAAETIASRRNMLVSQVLPEVRPVPNIPAAPVIAKPTTKQCPKCKVWIHRDATKCPHCRTAQPATPWAYAAALIAFGGIALFCCGPCSLLLMHNGQSSTPKTAEETRKEQIEKYFSAWDGSHRGLTEHIKRVMNDPDSYQHDETRYVDKGDHLLVFTKFRGKNAFGGVVRNSVIAKVDLQGNVIEIISGP